MIIYLWYRIFSELFKEFEKVIKEYYIMEA